MAYRVAEFHASTILRPYLISCYGLLRRDDNRHENRNQTLGVNKRGEGSTRIAMPFPRNNRGHGSATDRMVKHHSAEQEQGALCSALSSIVLIGSYRAASPAVVESERIEIEPKSPLGANRIELSEVSKADSCRPGAAVHFGGRSFPSLGALLVAASAPSGRELPGGSTGET